MRASKVTFLLGAGASYEADVPMMPEIGRRFLKEFSLPDLLDDLANFSRELALTSVEWKERRNVEVLLQKLATIAAHDNQPLRRRAAAILRFELMKFVLKCTSRHNDDLHYLDGLSTFCEPGVGMDIFSLNYDTVIEDWCVQQQLQWTDGFDAEGEWAPEAFYSATQQVRLYKLHGSVTWHVRNGAVRHGRPAGTWFAELQSGKLSSMTLDTMVVYPATEKGPTGLLEALLDQFGKALTATSVLIIAGYRCADDHITMVIRRAIETNPRMRILCCNPEAVGIVGALSGKDGWQPFSSRLHVYSEKWGPALAGDLARRAIELYEPTVACQSYSSPEICLGHFSAVRTHGGSLLLACRSTGGGRIERWDSHNEVLHTIRDGFGDVRDFIVVGNDIYVVDCRLHDRFTGLGGIWRVNLTTRRRRLLATIPGVAALRDLAQEMREHSYDPLQLGILRWPTSITASDEPNELFVQTARRIVQVFLRPLSFRAVTTDCYFNASAITYASGRRLIVAEHVFGHDISQKGIGTLWEVNADTGVRRPIKAGLHLGHHLEYLAAEDALVASEAIAPDKWRLIRVNRADGQVSVISDEFHGKAAFSLMGWRSAIVTSRQRYEGFSQGVLLRTMLRSGVLPLDSCR